jgi:DNA topoisomerase-1
MKTLLIVESPAKSKTIEKLLGKDYVVLSSFGHIRDLESKVLGIDVEDGFKPNYKLKKDRSKQIKAIGDAIKNVDRVLLASDEDREGEAIAWHIAVVFKLDIKNKNRICFHEITEKALKEAVSNPRTIDMSMVNSQQARRILDRLVGFKLSPLLWKHIGPNLSAGRVQSSALKICCIQENEISNFIGKKTIKTNGFFNKKINATLNKVFENEDESMEFLGQCKVSNGAIFKISSIDKSTVEKCPPPPYTTSTIQQDVGTRFGLGAKQIMSILQKLYESGLITYHRTDSTNLSSYIQEKIKDYVLDKWGKSYLKIRNFKSKIKCAQEAHEAIRPTYIEKTVLDGDTFDSMSKKVYEIIWKRTVASQMSVSKSDVYKISIENNNRPELFIAKAEKLIFDGYKRVYDDTDKSIESNNKTDDSELENNDFIIDDIQVGEILNYIKITCIEKYQNPPARYNEASLIKKMEKSGIGRPSTYANIMETLIDRKYLEKKNINGVKKNAKSFTLHKDDIKTKTDEVTIGAEKKKLVVTELGFCVNKFLDEHFKYIVDTKFTADLEEKLDDIANNNAQWNGVVGDFYKSIEPQFNTLNQKEEIAKSKDSRKKFLGKTDDTYGSSLNVYAYLAKFGPVFQIGDGPHPKPTFLKMDPKFNLENVTIDDYKNAIMTNNLYPKILGKYKDINVSLKKGPYGFYIEYNRKNFKLKPEFNEGLNIDEAIECLEESGDKERKLGKYTIKNGTYGPYILYNKKFYSIPKDYIPENLTIENCDTIIKLPKKKFVKK